MIIFNIILFPESTAIESNFALYNELLLQNNHHVINIIYDNSQIKQLMDNQHINNITYFIKHHHLLKIHLSYLVKKYIKRHHPFHLIAHGYKTTLICQKISNLNITAILNNVPPRKIKPFHSIITTQKQSKKYFLEAKQRPHTIFYIPNNHKSTQEYQTLDRNTPKITPQLDSDNIIKFSIKIEQSDSIRKLQTFLINLQSVIKNNKLKRFKCYIISSQTLQKEIYKLQNISLHNQIIIKILPITYQIHRLFGRTHFFLSFDQSYSQNELIIQSIFQNNIPICYKNEFALYHLKNNINSLIMDSHNDKNTKELIDRIHDISMTKNQNHNITINNKTLIQTEFSKEKNINLMNDYIKSLGN